MELTLCFNYLNVIECLPVLHSCLVPLVARRRHQIFWNRRYKLLWAAMWVIEIELPSSGRASALHCWAIYQPSSSWFNSPAENRHHSCQIFWSFVLHACFFGNLFQIHLSSWPDRRNVCMFSHTVFSHFLFQLFFIDQSQQWTTLYFSLVEKFELVLLHCKCFLYDGFHRQCID